MSVSSANFARAFPGDSVLLQLVDAFLGREKKPECKLLSVGGAGHDAALAKSLPGWNVIARRPEELVQLPSEEYFDAAFIWQVLESLPGGEPVHFLTEIGEGLNPGAPIIIAGIFGDLTTTRYKRLETLRTTWAKNHDAGSVISTTDGPPSAVRPLTEDELKNALREAGFIDVQRFYQALNAAAWTARKQR